MKVWLLAVAVLLAVVAAQTEPVNWSVVVVGTNATTTLNTPQLLLDSGNWGRNWAEVVNNQGTNNIIVCDGPYMFTVTNTLYGVTYTNWAGTVLMPGGSYTVRPFGSQGVNAGSWKVWGVVQGIGTNVVGSRDARR